MKNLTQASGKSDPSLSYPKEGDEDFDPVRTVLSPSATVRRGSSGLGFTRMADDVERAIKILIDKLDVIISRLPARLQPIVGYIVLSIIFLVGIIVSLAAIGFSLFVYLGIGIGIFENWSAIVQLFQYFHSAQIIAAILAVLCGIILYIFRLEARIHYGMTEIMFGVISICAAIFHAANMETSTLQAGAGIYIIVRGVDNFKIGLDERPNHRFWRAWNKVYCSNTSNRFRHIVGLPIAQPGPHKY